MTAYLLDAHAMTTLLEAIEPVLDYDTKQPKVNDKGETQYRASLRCISDLEEKPFGMDVKIWLASPPKIQPYTPVTLKNLVARPWEANGRSGISFTAEAMAYAKQQQG